MVGIQDLVLSEQLRLKPDLTLDKAKQLIQQQESVKLQQDFLHKPLIKEKNCLDAVIYIDSPLPEESYQQYHQLKDHITLHFITAEGVVGEYILDTHVQEKMLCALNVTGGAITVYSVSLLQLQ